MHAKVFIKGSFLQEAIWGESLLQLLQEAIVATNGHVIARIKASDERHTTLIYNRSTHKFYDSKSFSKPASSARATRTVKVKYANDVIEQFSVRSAESVLKYAIDKQQQPIRQIFIVVGACAKEVYGKGRFCDEPLESFFKN